MASETFEQTLDLILDAGQTMLENGGEVFRAQQTMEIMARSLQMAEFHVYVLTNGIFARPGRRAAKASVWCAMCRWFPSTWAVWKRSTSFPVNWLPGN